MSETTQKTDNGPSRPGGLSVMIYARYERFWHWSQALLIFILLFTGLGLHGVHSLIPFGLGVKIHTISALTLIVLWIFTTFWHFTTGQWRHYLPARSGLLAVIRFYTYGILLGEPHPYKKSMQRKQNALQNLAYVGFMVLIGPALWSTGIVYLLYNFWGGWGWAQNLLPVVAFLHTAAAYVLGIFIVVHVYMTTTGKTPLHYIKTMITGYDKIELSEVEEAYMRETGQKIGDE